MSTEVVKRKYKRLYVAGPYSDSHVIAVFQNMRKGIRQAVDVLLLRLGWAPFCPWLDYQFTLALRDGESLNIEDYYNYSMAWLEVSDAVLVLPYWRHSKGTHAEIKRAKELGIPVYYNVSDFLCGEAL